MIKIRMCICCRKRFSQNILLRLQIVSGVVCKWNKKGRSFYLCDECVNSKNYINSVCRVHKIDNKDSRTKFLKEMVHEWQKNNHQK